MPLFCPEIWREDPTPPSEQDCESCGLYKQGTRMVWGEGNPEAPIMIVLDNPGAREDKEGNPIVCGTRQTLQQAIQEVGLEKEHVYVTYILKRRPIRKYDKEITRKICMRHHLYKQLAQLMPKLILCLGNVAVQSFFQDPDAEVKKMRKEWHNVRGFPVSVAYHPLAVRRRPNLYKLFIEDLTLVANQLNTLQKK